MENQHLEHLLHHSTRLLAYVRSKVNDPDLAEDVLQESLLKAMRAAPDLRDEEKLLPWFYSILNNAITDLYRRQQVEMRSLQQVAVVYDATVVGEAQMRDVLAEADYPVVETDAAQPEGLTLVEAGASCGCCRI